MTAALMLADREAAARFLIPAVAGHSIACR